MATGGVAQRVRGGRGRLKSITEPVFGFDEAVCLFGQYFAWLSILGGSIPQGLYLTPPFLCGTLQ